MIFVTSLIIDAYFSKWTEFLGVFGLVLYLFCYSLTLIQSGAWFLVFDLSYYNLSYRINLLNKFIASIAIRKNIKNERIRKLRTCGFSFDQLCQASDSLSSAFSFSVLLILLLLMITSATSLFFFLNYPSPMVFNATAPTFLLSFVGIILLTRTAESPVTEVSINHK